MIRPVRPPPPRLDPANDPPRLLLVGSPGSGKSALCRARFTAALTAHGPRGALLLLPTYGEVEHEKRVAVSRRGVEPAGAPAPGRRGARSGAAEGAAPEGSARTRVDGLFDEAYATFTSLPERTTPGLRVARLPSRVERDLLAGEALRLADVPAFRDVRDRPGFRARFLRLVKEMKQTGGDPAALRAQAAARAATLSSPAARERLEGFLRAWEVYDGLLGVPDHEDALRALLLRLRTDPPEALRRLACLAVDGFDDLTGLESALLLACGDAVTAGGGRVVLTLPFDPAREALYAPSAALIARLRGQAGFVVHALPACRRSEDPAIAALAAGLFSGADAPPAEVAPGGGVRAIVGADPADEVDRIGREVLRLVREEDVSDPVSRRRAGLATVSAASIRSSVSTSVTPRKVAFRDVAIVFRRLDEVGPWAQRALEALGVPTRLVGAGSSLVSEAPVRALTGPLRLFAGEDGEAGRPFDAAALLDHARWTALASGADPAPSPDDVDRLDARWRSEGFPADWASARPAFAHAGAGLAAWAGRLEAARVACAAAKGPRQVFDALEAALEALAPPAEPSGFDAEGRVRDPAADARSARADAALEALRGVAQRLRAAHERTGLLPSITGAQGAEALLAAAREASAGAADRRLDAVALLDAEEARHWEVRVVFVAGLVEKAFPLHPREDVFLRDADRATLCGDRALELRTARDGEDRERRLFLSAVTRAWGRVYLSRHAAGEDGREKAASLFWDEVARALVVRDGPRVRRLEEPPPDLGRVHAPCDEARSEGDLCAAIATSLGAAGRGLGPAGDGADDDRRLAVALAREGGDEVASWLARAARFRRLGADAPPASAVPLFVRAVAEVSPSQVGDGVLCRHRHFLRHVARVPEDDLPLAGPAPDRRDVGTAVHAALCEAVRRPEASPAEVAAATLEAARDLPDSALRDFLRTDLERLVTLFRRREAAAAASGFAPAHVEFGFGREAGRPVALAGDTVLLRGKVDRVDLRPGLPTPTAIVVDYKTSRGGVEDVHRDMKSGADVQLPLYALAVERLTGARVVALEVYAASARGRRQLVDADHAEALEARAEGHEATELAPEAFRDLLAHAEERAAELVAETRAAVASSLRREVADAETCAACAWRGVCRPDEARVGTLARDLTASVGAP